MNTAQRAREQLRTWPHLAPAPASCGTGDALLTAGSEIVHFHSDRDADLHLTGAAIDRLRAELDRSTAVRLHPDSEWVTVHLDCDGDADLLVSMISVALRAHAGPRPVPAPTAVRCNLARVEIASLGQGATTETPPVSLWRSHAPRFPRGGRRPRPHREA